MSSLTAWSQSRAADDTNCGTNVTMHTPPLAGSGGEHVVGDVAGVVGHRAAGRVREDDGPRGGGEGVAHGRGRDVREVDEHPDPVHLPHHLAAERREPAVRGLVGGGVRPRGVAVVRQGQVAHPAAAQLAERVERAVDAVPALGAHQRRHPPRRERRLHLGDGGRELQVVGVALGELAHERHLLQHGGDGGGPGERARHVDRPELGADPARPQPGQVGVQLRDARREVDGAPQRAQRPRQVVVAVDQRGGGEQVQRAGGGGHRCRVALPHAGRRANPSPPRTTSPIMVRWLRSHPCAPTAS